MSKPALTPARGMPVHVFALSASGLLSMVAAIGYLINKISPLFAVELIAVMAAYYLVVGLYELFLVARTPALKGNETVPFSRNASERRQVARIASLTRHLSPSNE
ncbi:MAG: hypothetical protein ACO1RA_19795 [Planctomycetaceae bacterium]